MHDCPICGVTLFHALDRCATGDTCEDCKATQKANGLVWCVQGYYNDTYGWEDVTASESRSEARDELAVYRGYEPNTRFRIVRRVEK